MKIPIKLNLSESSQKYFNNMCPTQSEKDYFVEEFIRRDIFEDELKKSLLSEENRKKFDGETVRDKESKRLSDTVTG